MEQKPKTSQKKPGNSSLTAILILVGMIAIGVFVVLTAPKEQSGGVFWFAAIALFFSILLIISIVYNELQKKLVREMKFPNPHASTHKMERPREEKFTLPPHPFEYRIFDRTSPLQLSPAAATLFERANTQLGQFKSNLMNAAFFIWAWYLPIGMVLTFVPHVLPASLNILCIIPLTLLAAWLLANPKKTSPEIVVLIWGGLNVIGCSVIILAALSSIFHLLADRENVFGLIMVIVLSAFALTSYVLFNRYLGEKIRRHTAAVKGLRLLILWVFGQQQNLLKILGDIGMFWRYIGSVQFLQGGEFTVDMNQVLSYIGGKRNLLVRTPQQLQEKIRTFKNTPTWSGEFPSHSMLCGDEVWKSAIDHFMQDANFIAMNLSGFSPTNQGCLYELALLIDRFPLQRILFLADDTTDLDFLIGTLRRNWETMPDSSPNHIKNSAPVTIYKLRPSATGDKEQMLKLFFEIAASPSGVK